MVEETTDPLERDARFLPERFRPIRILGRGATSVVWLAQDSRTGLTVALKQLMERWSRQGTPSLERARREHAMMLELDHPNVLRTFEHGEKPLPWLAVEAHQRSLKDAISLDGPLDLPETLRMARDVLRALQYLHGLGIVHRDVKPGNVLLAEDGRYVLADLGIARGYDARITRTDQMLGSLMYMAPEQRVDAHNVDHRADLYGLAATLWHTCIGRAPPDLSLLYLRPELLNRLPEALRPVVQRAAQSDPEARYASAAAMEADLPDIA